MRNIAAEPPTSRTAEAISTHLQAASFRPRRRVQPLELSNWVEERLERLADRWLREIQSRYDRTSEGVNGLLEEFVDLLVRFLPAMLGPYRDQVEPLWVRGAELFGNVAARRGLAAGEVIEEFQILREAVIRLLYQEPPLDGAARISLREVLRLNRAIDRGVTHASVGHTDALFFSLFEGSGVPDVPPTAELKAEIQSQLDGLREELREAIGPSLAMGSPVADEGR
jgi:AcrR family transcriptional regulator